MSVIPDEVGTQVQRLEVWALRNMALDVRLRMSDRLDVCLHCDHWQGRQTQLFIRCGLDAQPMSLAGGRCPEGHW